METGLYYYGARYMEPSTSIWYGVDPLAEKYPNMSGFAYTAGNPINATDPDGRDVVFLIDKKAAGGNGHMGMLLQDKSGAWYYMSQGGEGTLSQSGYLAGSDERGGVTVLKLVTAGKDGNPIPLTREQAIEAGTSGQLGYNYSESVTLETTSKQDGQIYKNALEVQKQHESGDKEYNLYFNNCVDACQDAVQPGTKIDMPTDIDPRPNSYFDELKEEYQPIETKTDEEGGD